MELRRLRVQNRRLQKVLGRGSESGRELQGIIAPPLLLLVVMSVVVVMLLMPRRWWERRAQRGQRVYNHKLGERGCPGRALELASVALERGSVILRGREEEGMNCLWKWDRR